MNSIQNISIQNHIHYIYNNILKYHYPTIHFQTTLNKFNFTFV